jgi:hypothetical protein
LLPPLWQTEQLFKKIISPLSKEKELAFTSCKKKKGKRKEKKYKKFSSFFIFVFLNNLKHSQTVKIV